MYEYKKPESNYERIHSSVGCLNILVKDTGQTRKIRIEGNHCDPGGQYNTAFSEMETNLSVSTLKKIASVKGRHFRDEIERSENPDYMYNQLKALLELFEISLSGKRILDFGCGAGAFSLNLLRLGANEIVGVDVDQKLLDIAKLRVGDFYTDGCTLRRIGYVNKHSGLPLQSESFDIVWPHAVMEHVFPKDRKYVLSELWRVLKKNGHLIIDATPNRLWIKESHTTGIYFLNYLPLRMACYLARKFSERVSENESVESLLSRGIRGCTYWEIHKRFPASLCLNNVLRKRDLNVFMSAWLHQGDSTIKGKAKKTFGKLMSSLDTILKLVHIPQTAFLPTHIMLFKKTSSPTP